MVKKTPAKKTPARAPRAGQLPTQKRMLGAHSDFVHGCAVRPKSIPDILYWHLLIPYSTKRIIHIARQLPLV